MKKTLTALTLIAALTGCTKEPQDKSEVIPYATIEINSGTYRALFIDRDRDGINDELKIERKLAPNEWKTFRGTKEEYFLTFLPQNPSPVPNGTVVNVVKPEFFNQYERLFTPNRENVISTYGGQSE